jgi:diguanylate cyclase (GGDEF)-like protein
MNDFTWPDSTDELIEMTSLGTPQARRHRRNTPSTIEHDVLALLATAAGQVVDGTDHLDASAADEGLPDRGTDDTQHDRLTGLPNRNRLLHRLSQALAEREAYVAVLFIDIDRFKLVNDTMGHHTGDELLVSVARRLRAALPDDYVVGRIGGDEFLVVVPRVDSARSAVSVAETVQACFATPFRTSEGEVTVSASVGITVQPPSAEGVSAETMLVDADAAMFGAKARGRAQSGFSTSG